MDTEQVRNLRQFFKGSISLDDDELDELQAELSRVRRDVLAELDRREILDAERKRELQAAKGRESQ